ncbi:16S rRNA (uracil(1498)-N(3))-methyltransferase [Brucepastera parasyntrophica]|uniref:RsmE family RNA methyltransferase n=1 Tax=Brucepastera parasyntrophica TaxID=2880008 RepID=UPI00210F1A76|nr:RsmE family RNA methyltransferase [Brucepastera parasyntrophica]ULQ60885.1 16S rRNA (uracil(1498)-N(3))-methyltransferase [Brucepastera parasyntrophica]
MRQLVLSEFPDRNGILVLGGSNYHYLAKVLRKTSGSSVEARLPDGSIRTFRILDITRETKEIRLSAAEENGQSGQNMPDIPSFFPRIILFQWMIKNPKMEQLVRQATEMGVSEIIPVTGERSLFRNEKESYPVKQERWERIIREARQQSGSSIPTGIFNPVSLSEAVRIWNDISGDIPENRKIAFVLTETPLERKTLHEYLGRHIKDGEDIPVCAALAVGPEGGMTEQETETLTENNFLKIHFNTNILRSETAALYGVAAIQNALTELGKWQLKEYNL